MDAAHESEVLKPLDPSIKDDENAWPQFPLRDVIVYSQRTRQPISLLAAHKTDKVRVVGILHDQDADSDGRKQFKKRFQKQQRIYVMDVDMYSYGKYQDGTLAFWAAGKAGWFELRTQVAGYRETYAQMEEATEMLYFLVGKAARQRKDFKKATEKQIKGTMTHIFGDFLVSEHNTRQRRKDLQDVIDGFSEHRHFLAKCMLEGAEGINWANTPSLRWFAKSFPSDLAAIQDVVNQTGSTSVEDLDDQPAPAPVKPQRHISSDEEMTGNQPAVGRRSRRLAAAAGDEDNSSEELDNRRGRMRGKHKRKSMLRIPGSAKTPKKSNVKRYDGLRSIPMPDMDYFRDQAKQEMDGVEYEDEVPEEDEISQSLVHDLKYSELNGNEEGKIAPVDSYWEVKGPNDTWNCPYDGCNHMVWDAGKPTGKALIKTHYAQTHQDSIEELIKSESRPWAKTSYLLEKVRSMQAQGAAISKNGTATTVVAKKEDEQDEIEFPRPIKRRI